MLTALKEKLMAPDLAAAFVAALNAELNRPRDEAAASRVVLERETAELQRKAEQLKTNIDYMKQYHSCAPGRAQGKETSTLDVPSTTQLIVHPHWQLPASSLRQRGHQFRLPPVPPCRAEFS